MGHTEALLTFLLEDSNVSYVVWAGTFSELWRKTPVSDMVDNKQQCHVEGQ